MLHQMRYLTKVSMGHRPHHWSIVLRADGAESEWEEWKIVLDIACLCGAKQNAMLPYTKPTRCTLNSNFWSLSTGGI